MSSVPIIKVMETQNAVQEGMEDVNLTEVVKMLADSVALIGSINGKIVTKQKDLIWQELPFKGSTPFFTNFGHNYLFFFW